MAYGVTIEVQGGKFFLKGNTYPIKDTLKAEGFRFDGTAKAWWTTDHTLALKHATGLTAAPVAAPIAPAAPVPTPVKVELADLAVADATEELAKVAPPVEVLAAPAPKAAAPADTAGETVNPDANVIKGTATYKGKKYFVLWAGYSAKVDCFTAKLCFRDGTVVFWAKGPALQLEKNYAQARSINGLKAFAAAKAAEEGKVA